MSIPNRTVSLTGVFAKDALTTIPGSPVSGVSYRDTSITKETVEEGWPYKEIVDSGSFNQIIYEYAALTDLLERYGFMPWCSLTDYEAGALCLGSDGVIYQAVQATGPSTTAYDPANDTNHTYWVDFVGSTYVTLATNQTISGDKTFSGDVTFSNATAKEKIAGFGMPDYASLVTLASGDTAPANGYLCILSGGSRVYYILIDDVTVYHYNWGASYGSPDNCYIPVAKGSVVTTTDSSSVSFVPCVGG